VERFKLLMVGNFDGYEDNFACWYNILVKCAGLSGTIPVVEYHLWETPEKNSIQDHIIQMWQAEKIKAEVHWYHNSTSNLHATAFTNYERDPSFCIVSSPDVHVTPQESFYKHALTLFKSHFDDYSSVEVFDISIDADGNTVVGEDVKMSKTWTLSRLYNDNNVRLTNSISKQSLSLD